MLYTITLYNKPVLYKSLSVSAIRNKVSHHTWMLCVLHLESHIAWWSVSMTETSYPKREDVVPQVNSPTCDKRWESLCYIIVLINSRINHNKHILARNREKNSLVKCAQARAISGWATLWEVHAWGMTYIYLISTLTMYALKWSISLTCKGVPRYETF